MYFYIATIVLQVICIVHALKTGRAYWWLAVIFFLPLAGSIAYFIVEILPDFSRRGGSMASAVAKKLDPERDLKRRTDDLTLSDTVENRLNLADEYMEVERYDDAVELYQSCLSGVHKTDPKIILNLAAAQFQLKRYTDVKDLLDRLIETNPNFKSSHGHLLYARALEELGEKDAALEEYRVLAGYYSGMEAKCRYALLLKQAGETAQARELFN